MANHKSAVKRAKQNLKKNLVNQNKRSEVKTAIKKLRQAITDKNKTLVTELLPTVQSLLAKLAKSSATSKKTAARRTSRLASQVSKL